MRVCFFMSYMIATAVSGIQERLAYYCVWYTFESGIHLSLVGLYICVCIPLSHCNFYTCTFVSVIYMYTVTIVL